jgi:hypothetical protein
MWARLVAGCVLAGVWLATGVSAQQPSGRRLDLHFHADGTVSLGAQNVSAREILLEWRRQCGCEVINAEEVPGGAIMLPVQFDHADQRVVLQSLLRQAAGYVLTPRPADSTAPSDYGTIYILARSSASSGSYVPPVQAPTSLLQPPTSGFPDDEIPPVSPADEPAESEPAAEPAPTTPPPGVSPFGSRTYNPFVTSSPGPANTPGMTPLAPGQSTPPAPGTTPATQPAQGPAPSSPFQRSTVVPIVAVPPDDN